MELVSQVLPHQAKAGQSPEAEPAHSAMDSIAHWEYHSVRFLVFCHSLFDFFFAREREHRER